jgi:hypothetical protein
MPPKKQNKSRRRRVDADVKDSFSRAIPHATGFLGHACGVAVRLRDAAGSFTVAVAECQDALEFPVATTPPRTSVLRTFPSPNRNVAASNVLPGSLSAVPGTVTLPDAGPIAGLCFCGSLATFVLPTTRQVGVASTAGDRHAVFRLPGTVVPWSIAACDACTFDRCCPAQGSTGVVAIGTERDGVLLCRVNSSSGGRDLEVVPIVTIAIPRSAQPFPVTRVTMAPAGGATLDAAITCSNFLNDRVITAVVDGGSDNSLVWAGVRGTAGGNEASSIGRHYFCTSSDVGPMRFYIPDKRAPARNFNKGVLDTDTIPQRQFTRLCVVPLDCSALPVSVSVRTPGLAGFCDPYAMFVAKSDGAIDIYQSFNAETQFPAHVCSWSPPAYRHRGEAQQSPPTAPEDASPAAAGRTSAAGNARRGPSVKLEDVPLALAGTATVVPGSDGDEGAMLTLGAALLWRDRVEFHSATVRISAPAA